MAVESPSHLREHSGELTLTLLAALAYCRTWEVTDAPVTLLLWIVHAIEARADRRVTKQLVAEFKRVYGKENLPFRVAEAATARPDDTVRQVVFPVIGEDNLRNLAEYTSSGSTYRRTVQTTYRGSYSNHYRKGLIRLLEVAYRTFLFRCSSRASSPSNTRRSHPGRGLRPRRRTTPRPGRCHLAQLAHQRTSQALSDRLRPLKIKRTHSSRPLQWH